jgi:hypothetical protein
MEPQTETETSIFDTEMIGGVAIPVDPMELLQCDSCQ